MMAPVSALPEPFSVPLQAKLTAALASVPAGKRGWLSLGLTRQGAEAAIGWRPKPGWTVSGYGVTPWTRTGWQAGVRAELIW